MINIARLSDQAIILDPMVGSGTTLVEARLSNRISYGLDMNPLAVFIAHVKCQALEITPGELNRACNDVMDLVRKPIQLHARNGKFESLDQANQSYLAKWVHHRTIKELDHVESAIRTLPTDGLQNFFLVALSNILRRVSLQKTDDLRIRREQREIKENETIDLFVREATRSARTVSAFLSQRGTDHFGDYTVRQADARVACQSLPELTGKVDAVITSPPYATALPYIDTDRLSLIYLNLLQRQRHKPLDAMMIGNREVTPRVREEYWHYYETDRCLLPAATRTMIERIEYLNSQHPVGFRRKNLAALLSKYFFDMRQVLEQAFVSLKPGGKMFLVVGANRTQAGNEKMVIATPEHLGDIAQSLGFRMSSALSMEMLQSRDLFRKNAVPSERILSLQNLSNIHIVSPNSVRGFCTASHIPRSEQCQLVLPQHRNHNQPRDPVTFPIGECPRLLRHSAVSRSLPGNHACGGSTTYLRRTIHRPSSSGRRSDHACLVLMRRHRTH